MKPRSPFRIWAVATLIGLTVSACTAHPHQPRPSLHGEHLQATSGVGGGTSGCTGRAGTFTFAATGTATGPFVGHFTEHGSITVTRSVPTAYTASFTISSTSGNVHGEQSLAAPSAHKSAATGFCLPTYGLALVAATYTATITPPNGEAFTDRGRCDIAVTGGSAATTDLREECGTGG